MNIHRTLTLVAAVLLGSASLAESAEFFVSPSGQDSWSGLWAEPSAGNGPFATVERARDAARELRRVKTEETVRVTIRGGTYRLEKTVEFGPADSGTKDSSVVYAAAKGERVSFTGGRELNPTAFRVVTDADILQRLPKEARGQVVAANLKEHGITDFGVMRPRGQGRPTVSPALELFFKDEPLPLARWPNRGMVRRGEVLDKGGAPRYEDFSPRGGTFRFDYDRPSRWTRAKDLWLSGYFARGYAPDTIDVKSIDLEKRTITLARPHRYGLETVGPTQEYFALNLLEEIDEPGEWYLDREFGRLYLWPPQDFRSGKLAISLLERPMMALEGVSYMTLRGFTFEVSRGMGLYIERGEGNLIAGCAFRNLGTSALVLGQGIKVDPAGLILYKLQNGADRGEVVAYEPASRELGSALYNDATWNRQAGRNHTVAGCDFSHIGASAIVLGGGERKTLTPGSNSVINCHLWRTGRLDGRAPAIGIDGVGNRVANCLIHDVPLTAISFGGNDHLIEGNEIHDVCLPPAHDMGAVYTCRDPSAQGTILRRNFFHHLGNPDTSVFAIYLDDGACGITVRGNVFYKVSGERAVHGWGHDHVIEKNLFIDTRAQMPTPLDNSKWPAYMNEPVRELWMKRQLDVLSPPYTTRYPQMARLYDKDPSCLRENIVRDNLSERSGGFGESTSGQANFVTNADPGFVGPAKMNFQLLPLSPVFTALPGFENIPMEGIGLRADEFRTESTLPKRMDRP